MGDGEGAVAKGVVGWAAVEEAVQCLRLCGGTGIDVAVDGVAALALGRQVGMFLGEAGLIEIAGLEGDTAKLFSSGIIDAGHEADVVLAERLEEVEDSDRSAVGQWVCFNDELRELGGTVVVKFLQVGQGGVALGGLALLRVSVGGDGERLDVIRVGGEEWAKKGECVSGFGGVDLGFGLEFGYHHVVRHRGMQGLQLGEGKIPTVSRDVCTGVREEGPLLVCEAFCSGVDGLRRDGGVEDEARGEKEG